MRRFVRSALHVNAGSVSCMPAKVLFSLILALSLMVPSLALADEAASNAEALAAEVPAVDWMAEEARLMHVTDAAGLLTDGELSRLEATAQAIEDQYGFGAYIVTVGDYRRFSEASVFDAAMAIYTEYSLGAGPGKDGLMLLLSMNDRDYSLITYGETGNSVFGEAARASMTDYFLDDFARNDWYGGFADYLEQTDARLQAAENGEPYGGAYGEPYGEPVGPYDDPYGDHAYDDRYYAGGSYLDDEDVLTTLGMYAVGVLVVPFVIMLIVIAVMDGKMRSVAPARHATEYVAGNLQLTGRYDHFTHTTETVVRVKSDNDGPGGGFGGGGISFSGRSGGFGGTSGKF